MKLRHNSKYASYVSKVKPADYRVIVGPVSLYVHAELLVEYCGFFQEVIPKDIYPKEEQYSGVPVSIDNVSFSPSCGCRGR